MADDDAITYAPNPAPAATHHSSSPSSIPSAPITIPPPNRNRVSLTAHYTHPPPSQQQEQQHLPTSASLTHPHAKPSSLPIPATGYGYGYDTGLDDGPLQPDFPAAAAGEAPRLPSLPPNSIDNLPLPVPLPPPPPRRQPGEPLFCACAAAPAGRASALKTFRIRTTLRGAAIWARFRPFAMSGDAFAKPGGSALRKLLPTEREHVIRVALVTGTPDLLAPTQVGWWFALHEATEVGSGSWTGMRKERKRMVYGEILEGRDGLFGG